MDSATPIDIISDTTLTSNRDAVSKLSIKHVHCKFPFNQGQYRKVHLQPYCTKTSQAVIDPGFCSSLSILWCAHYPSFLDFYNWVTSSKGVEQVLLMQRFEVLNHTVSLSRSYFPATELTNSQLAQDKQPTRFYIPELGLIILDEGSLNKTKTTTTSYIPLRRTKERVSLTKRDDLLLISDAIFSKPIGYHLLGIYPEGKPSGHRIAILIDYKEGVLEIFDSNYGVFAFEKVCQQTLTLWLQILIVDIYNFMPLQSLHYTRLTKRNYSREVEKIKTYV